MNTSSWKRVKNNVPNLHVLVRNGVEVGYIWRANSTCTCTDAWKAFKGIGQASKFLGTDFSKSRAMNLVEVA